ncbi:autoinducer binding domain-containing protein [Neorhizobium sp. R1-B]|nr:autoinducer binding domain-containing protein [Neorhizobium sp. R1-B]
MSGAETNKAVRNGPRSGCESSRWTSDHYPYYCAIYSDLGSNMRRQEVSSTPWFVSSVGGFSRLTGHCRLAAGTGAENFTKHAHGIGLGGLTVPVRGRNGERSLFSVTRELPKCDWLRLRASTIHELQILPQYFHEKALSAGGLWEGDRDLNLAKRESQYLQLLAKVEFPNSSSRSRHQKTLRQAVPAVGVAQAWCRHKSSGGWQGELSRAD